MDIQRVELKRTPPREPLTSLPALVRDFKWRFPRERRDTVVTRCDNAVTLQSAVWLATDSIKADGKHHNHQVKVRKSARDELAEILLRRENKLAMRSCKTFHQLWNVVDTVKPWGIGPLTVYDVATRIGAYLDLEPEYLYLHTGARAGLIALFDSYTHGGYMPAYVKTADYVLLDILPGHVRQKLTADEWEDFLCTYRTMFLDMFNGVRRNFEGIA